MHVKNLFRRSVAAWVLSRRCLLRLQVIRRRRRAGVAPGPVAGAEEPRPRRPRRRTPRRSHGSRRPCPTRRSRQRRQPRKVLAFGKATAFVHATIPLGGEDD